MQFKFSQHLFHPLQLLLTSLLFSCQAIRLDINFYSPSGNKTKLKLICERFVVNPQVKEERKTSEINYQLSSYFTDVEIDASQHYRCFFMESHAVVDGNRLKEEVVSKLHRELSEKPESVPVATGTCPPGYRINGKVCLLCPPGSYTQGHETECIPCAKHFFSDSKGSNYCWPCPEDKVTAGEGSTSMEDCISPDNSSPSAVPIIDIVALILLVVALIAGFIFLSWWCCKNIRRDQRNDDLGMIEKGPEPNDEDLDDESESIGENIYEDMGENIYEEIGDYQIKKGPEPNDEDLDDELYSNFDSQEESDPEKHMDKRATNQSDDYEVPDTAGPIYASIKKKVPPTTENIQPDEYYEIPVAAKKAMQVPNTKKIPSTSKNIQPDDYYEVPVPAKKAMQVPNTKTIPSTSKNVEPDDYYEVPVTTNKAMQVQLEHSFRERVKGCSLNTKNTKTKDKHLNASSVKKVQNPSSKSVHPKHPKPKIDCNKPDELVVEDAVKRPIHPRRSDYADDRIPEKVKNRLETLKGSKQNAPLKKGSDLDLDFNMEKFNRFSNNITKIMEEDSLKKRSRTSKSEASQKTILNPKIKSTL